MGADMSKHLLSLADLNAAAPGVLDVVFGPDGDFTNAPRWQPPIWDGYIHALFDCFEGDRGVGLLGLQYEVPYERAALDLRIPTVAARLLALLRRLNVQSRSTRAAIRASTNRHLSGTWTESDAADLGVVVLALAPQIAAIP